MNNRDGCFCHIHLEYEQKCSIRECLQDALHNMPACEEHKALYREFEARFGCDQSGTLHGHHNRMGRQLEVQNGERKALPWEPPVEQWHPDVQHYWQARHIKTVEFAVGACGVPLAWTQFPIAEGEREIIDFMNEAWPLQHDHLKIVVIKAPNGFDTL